MPSIGPSLPTHLAPTLEGNDGTGSGSDSDSDDYAPALPPGFAPPTVASAPSAPAEHPTSARSNGRVVGPALPPHLVRREDSDSDDEIGPSPIPAGPAPAKDAVAEFREREERRRKAAEEALKPKKLEREEWMLKPPTSSDLMNNIDTTKIVRGGRRFNASSKAPTQSSSSASTLWTETPAERQQRLADEIAGKRRRTENAEPEGDQGEELERAKRRRAEETVRADVDKHTRNHRGAALLDQHSSGIKADKDEDKGPPAIWEHGRDMALSGRLMDDKQRERIIKDSRGLGDRFGAGKSGSFL